MLVASLPSPGTRTRSTRAFDRARLQGFALRRTETPGAPMWSVAPLGFDGSALTAGYDERAARFVADYLADLTGTSVIEET